MITAAEAREMYLKTIEPDISEKLFGLIEKEAKSGKNFLNEGNIPGKICDLLIGLGYKVERASSGNCKISW